MESPITTPPGTQTNSKKTTVITLSRRWRSNSKEDKNTKRPFEENEMMVIEKEEPKEELRKTHIGKKY